MSITPTNQRTPPAWFGKNRENRSNERTPLGLEALVRVKESPNEEWQELTNIKDISAAGCGIRISRPIAAGRLILLATPLPRELRGYDHDLESYEIWAIVRRCIEITRPRADPYYSIGVAFIGKYPPIDHFQNPHEQWDLSEKQPSSNGFWQIARKYGPTDDAENGRELRRHTRLALPEELLLEFTDESGSAVMAELTVTENLSVGGASVFTQIEVEVGSFLRVTCERYNLTIIAIVRGRSVGNNGISRLHIEFVDKPFPLDGLM